jgi:hypothetical protein
MFVKLGQVLSTRADLLPAAVVAELSRLQDQVAPAPPDAVLALLKAELGRPVAEVFAELDPSRSRPPPSPRPTGADCAAARRWSSRCSGPASPSRSTATCWCWPNWPGWPRPAPPRAPAR